MAYIGRQPTAAALTASDITDGIVSTAKLTGNLVTPGTLDINGQELIVDADADTSITADTDDEIDFKTGGSDRAIITSTGLGIGNAAPSVSLSVGDDDDGGQGIVGKKALILANAKSLNLSKFSSPNVSRNIPS